MNSRYSSSHQKQLLGTTLSSSRFYLRDLLGMRWTGGTYGERSVFVLAITPWPIRHDKRRRPSSIMHMP